MQSFCAPTLVLVLALAACGGSERSALEGAPGPAPTEAAARPPKKAAPPLEKPVADAGPREDPVADAPETPRQPNSGDLVEMLDPLANPPAPVDDTADRESLKLLREQVKSLAEAPARELGEVLNAYSKVEDEALNMLDKACCSRNEDSKSYFTGQYREIFEESNRFMESAFTPEYVERQPWTDLLAGAQSAHWQQFELQEFQLRSGVLEVVGPTAGAGTNGIVAIPEAGGYRDFDLEMQFTLDGMVDLMFRLGRRVDNTVEFYTLSTKTNDESLQVGRTYTLRAKYIGNHLTGSITPEDLTLPEMESKWTMSRRGAIGAQMHENTELTVTRLRIRVLRAQ